MLESVFPPVNNSVSISSDFLSGDAASRARSEARTPEAPAGGSLENTTKSSDIEKEFIDEKTGEIQTFTREKGSQKWRVKFDRQKSRSDRFKLQTAAQNALEGYQNPKSKPFRTLTCLRRVSGDFVSVRKSRDYGNCHFSGLMMCGSPWTCPVCSSKIGTVREKEIQKAIDSCSEKGLSPLMVTLTFPHSRHDDLSEMVKRFRQALTFFRKTYGYKKLRSFANMKGLIRALEVTWGEKNGWHPHTHEIWFVRELSAKETSFLSKTVLSSWQDACKKAGFKKPNSHGVKVSKCYSAAEYLSKFSHDQKWGSARELTRANTKTSLCERFTPFDLLRSVSEKSENSDLHAKLFRDYATAFYGSRQIFWTPKLKDFFDIEDLSDTEIVEGEEPSVEVCKISKDQWRYVVRGADHRATVLSLAENLGSQGVDRFITSLVGNLRFDSSG